MAALLVALAGCDTSDIDLYSCVNPDKGHKDAEGKPDPCHHHDLDAGAPGDAGETCSGVCVPFHPADWYGPALVWMGDEADAPPCPTSAPSEGFTARRPPATATCATTCTCGPSSGSCAPPATLTANSGTCQNAAGATHTSFDPPAAWNGDCTAANAIPLGQLCGGVPCVQSVTIAPLTANESGCLPIEAPNVTPPPWGTFARACSASEFAPPCSTNTDTVCLAVAPGPEFKRCIAQKGDPAVLQCPASYPAKSVFYENFVDNRYCTQCTCGATETSTCVGLIGLFSAPACGAPLAGSLAIDAEGPKCHDVPAGSALGSKSASEPTYTPGTCPVTGGQLGQIDAAITRVICCQGTP